MSCLYLFNIFLDDFNASSAFDILIFNVEGNEVSVLQGLDYQICMLRRLLVETRWEDIGSYLSNCCCQEVSFFLKKRML